MSFSSICGKYILFLSIVMMRNVYPWFLDVRIERIFVDQFTELTIKNNIGLKCFFFYNFGLKVYVNYCWNNNNWIYPTIVIRYFSFTSVPDVSSNFELFKIRIKFWITSNLCTCGLSKALPTKITRFSQT